MKIIIIITKIIQTKNKFSIILPKIINKKNNNKQKKKNIFIY